jgi:acyl carrier protein
MSEQELRELICRRFLAGDMDFPIEPETRLLEEGICDSLGMVQIVSEIEKRWAQLRIPDQDITRENFGSIAAILRYLARHNCASLS